MNSRANSAPAAEEISKETSSTLATNSRYSLLNFKILNLFKISAAVS